jgi:hypothetical protein
MKTVVTKFKSLTLALKELEQHIRNGQHLETGRPFKSFDDGRSRELVANLMICFALNDGFDDERMTLCSDPTGSDGIILDTASGNTWQTEHVMVPSRLGSDTADMETLILEKIQQKRDKGGAAYASGKTLVVFVNAAGQPWYPNKIARKLPDPLYFDCVWVVGFQGVEDVRYVYQVTVLDVEVGNAPTWRIRLAPNFDGWTVEVVQ